MSHIEKNVTLNLPERFWSDICVEAERDGRTLDEECQLLLLSGMLASVCNSEAAAFKQWPADKDVLLKALEYARDGIVKMADYVDMEAVEATGLDVQDCRDCVELAIERAGVVGPEPEDSKPREVLLGKEEL